MTKHCCEAFEAHTGTHNKGFEFFDGWHLNGCCGGGCYVLADIRYCPFCGTHLLPPGEEDTNLHRNKDAGPPDHPDRGDV